MIEEGTEDSETLKIIGDLMEKDTEQIKEGDWLDELDRKLNGPADQS